VLALLHEVYTPARCRDQSENADDAGGYGGSGNSLVDLIAKVFAQRKTDLLRPRYLRKSPNAASFLADLDVLAGGDGIVSNPAALASTDGESCPNKDPSINDTENAINIENTSKKPMKESVIRILAHHYEGLTPA